MKIGILGTGDVGKALAKGFLALGHEVKMGARQAGNDKAKAFVMEAGKSASEGSFADAAAFGEIVVLATLGAANAEVLKAAGANLDGKILIDATNPLDTSKGFPPTLNPSGNDSGGEQVQRQVPNAKVVKAWNTIGNATMYKPDFPGGPPTMFIAGNDAGAKDKVGQLAKDFGFDVADLGPITSSRYLEAMCMAWVLYGVNTGTWGHAFRLLKK